MRPLLLLCLAFAPALPAQQPAQQFEARVLPVPILFVAPPIHASAPTFITSIDVTAYPCTPEQSRTFLPQQIETSAGTYGDPSRFLQTLAGVTSGSDQRNDLLVRGGNPSENAFIIDNIEIPSINQLATSTSTGGFVSMLDPAALSALTLHIDSYASHFDQRLSSVIEVSTRPDSQVEHRNILDLGIGGFGGSTTRPFGRAGSLFVSARQSVLQYVTDDIGINGVPIYRNALLRADSRVDSRNSWWGISLTGIDSLKTHPDPTDPDETSTLNINYSGWRNTSGINWQHLFSNNTFAVASLASSTQAQSILQNDQLQAGAEVYNEQSRDSITTAKYDLTSGLTPRITLNAGTRLAVDALHYTVAQPTGLQNPYSPDPTPLDATSLAHQFATPTLAAYAEAAITLPARGTLTLGERLTNYALGGHLVSTPHAQLTLPVLGHLASFGYAEYAQQPATLFLLAFNNLRTLAPIRSRQFTSSVQVADTRRARITLAAYEKLYSGYPVALNFPQLSLANIADTFGQAFLMFPMTVQGKGIARGVEFTADTHVTGGLDMTLASAWSRSWYSGLDGILRRGNFDLPLTANLTATYRLGRSYTLSGRYNTTSGRPYTPFDLHLSEQQNRGIYDLTQINALRSSPYSRLDLRIEQSMKIRAATLTWHAGLENALNHKNFYSQAWAPRDTAYSVSEHDQMPIFPDAGITYTY